MPSTKRQKRGKSTNIKNENIVDSACLRSQSSVLKNPHGKKDKRLKKRQDFLTKLQAERDAIKDKKAAKKRAETPVVGDMNPMTLALAELDSTIKSVAEEKPPRKPDTNNNMNKPSKMKGKQLQKQILDDILLMKSALASSSNSTAGNVPEGMK